MYSFICCIGYPFIICYHPLRIYFFPWLRYYIYTLFCCIPLFRTCFMFDDDEFNDIALGELFETNKENIEWRRCYDNKRCKFISNHIEPCDVIQGDVGDCWLMGAIACLAEHHGALHNLFEYRQVSVYGMYTVNLYKKAEKRWVKITVDDKIPYLKSSNKPLFAQSIDNEIWPLILEKVFAKFVGNYSKLKGGSIAWALEVLTGDCVMKFSQRERTWQKYRMVNVNKEINPRSVKFFGTHEKYDSDKMFDIFKEYDSQYSVLAAYIANNSEWKQSNGLIAGHAYSIIRVEEIGNNKLLQLRNPWGKFEWNGDWSDKSGLWNIHKYTKLRLNPSDKNDGVFWINWFDFQSIFTDVDICHRSTGIHDLVLDMHEGVCCGPTIGCVKGCCSYWCCCSGCKSLYYNKKSSNNTIHVSGKRCSIL